MRVKYLRCEVDRKGLVTFFLTQDDGILMFDGLVLCPKGRWFNFEILRQSDFIK
jgi:hypothetical protein